jgi:hypothetical protein
VRWLQTLQNATAIIDDQYCIQRMNVQHWVLKNLVNGGRDMIWAPLDVKDSSENKHIHVLDSGAGTGKKSVRAF